MDKEKIHLFRAIPILVIISLTAVLSVLLCMFNQLYWDEELCIAFLDILFLLVLIFELEFERKRKYIAYNGATTYSRIAGCYAVCCLLLFLFLFLPEFYRPVLLVPILMCAVSNEMISMSISIYLVLLFGLTGSGDYYELVCYCILIMLGVILAKAFEEKKFRPYIGILLTGINISVPIMFYYLSNGTVLLRGFLYGALCGGGSALFALLCYKKLKDGTMAELNNRLLDILSDDFAQVKELRAYFPGEYAHAKRVSKLCLECAKTLGFSENLCEAAGFYYRIGKWQGEPHVANGVKMADQLCFPVELVKIISEYYGEEALPSTPESALVHMIDALSIKLDALKQDVKKSAWNQEMIIYQTLNEFSSTGMYDSSGMSMNQFLKVREVLTKEKWTI